MLKKATWGMSYFTYFIFIFVKNVTYVFFFFLGFGFEQRPKSTVRWVSGKKRLVRHGLGFYFPWLQHKHGDTWTASA